MPDPNPGFRPWRQAWSDALYGERGFYRRDEGPRAHFETSANAGGGVVELFAEALARLATTHGCTTVVDVGAGRGELLAALASLVTGTTDVPVGLVGVDVVPRPAHLPAAVDWVVSPGGAALPDGLTALTQTLVVAHEWLDVVPCDVLQVDDDGVPREVEVDASGAERLGPAADAAQLGWCARWWPLDGAAPGTRVEVGLTRDAAWADLAGRMRSGVCLAVDYGHTLAERPSAGTLAAHRSGRLVRPVPDGSCDLTAHVALDSVASAASTAAGPGDVLRTQRAMLLGLGVDGVRPPSSGDTAAYLRELQRAGAAGSLLDPGGLGGFGWVMHVAATGQPDPPTARVER